MTRSTPQPSKLKQWLFKMPLMISCEEVEEFILDYLEGKLPSRQKRIFEWHLKLCRECRDYLKAYQRSLELSKAALAGEALPPLPEDLVEAILESRK